MQPVRLAAMIAAALVSAATLTGCTGGSHPQPAAAPTQSVYTPPPCPTPAAGKPPAWPRFLPTDLPKPAGAAIQPGGVSTTSDGVHIVKFTTPTSLRDSVLFIVNSYPKAGYALGRGDAEATEADAPFIHGEIRGVTRVSMLEQCKTLWLTATVNVNDTQLGQTPIIPPHTPSSSPSPLPFG
jgi:hypothetical protein